MDKKLILFLILSILIIGCKSYDNPQPSQPTQNPAIGSGCGITENDDSEAKLIKVPIARAL